MKSWKRAIVPALMALVAGVPALGATLSGNGWTADSDEFAATVSVLHSSQEVSLETHETGEDETFSIEIGSGAVAAAASVTNHFSHEIDLSNRVPSSVQFTLLPLRYSQARHSFR